MIFLNNYIDFNKIYENTLSRFVNYIIDKRIYLKNIQLQSLI